MARGYEREGPPPADGGEGVPFRDATPSMDTHFLLLEMGKLMERTDAQIKAVDRIDKKIDTLCSDVDAFKHKLSFLKGAVWILGGLIVIATLALGWYINGKLAISLK